MPLPNTPTFTPLDPLLASKLTDLVENDEALQDWSAFDAGTLPGSIIATNAVEARSLATNAITLGYAETTTSQTGITTITDLTGLSVTVTVPAGGRYIEIHGAVSLNGSTSNLAGLRIREGTDVLGVSRQPTNGTGGWSVRTDVWFRGVVTAGSHTYKLSLTLDAGSGSVAAEATTLAAGTYGPNFITVSAF